MQRNGTLFVALMRSLTKDFLCQSKIVVFDDSQRFDPFRYCITIPKKSAVNTVFQNPQDVIALELCTSLCAKSFLI